LYVFRRKQTTSVNGHIDKGQRVLVLAPVWVHDSALTSAIYEWAFALLSETWALDKCVNSNMTSSALSNRP